MKKIGLLLASAFVAFGAQAQWGLFGGVNFNHQIDHYQGPSTTNQIKVGAAAGVQYDISLNKNWSIMPALEYSLKGGEQQRTYQYYAADGIHQIQLKDKNSLHYVELPVDVVYKINMANGSKVFIGVGGYASVLLSAYSNYKYKNEVGGGDNPLADVTASGTRTLHIGDKDGDDVHRFDFGLNGMLGYQMANGWFVRGGVDVGVFNIIRTDNIGAYQSTLPSTVTSTDPTSKNLTYNLSIGYNF